MIDFCLQSHRPILYLKRQQKVHPAKRFEILRPRQHGLLDRLDGQFPIFVQTVSEPGLALSDTQIDSIQCLNFAQN